jgi:hypothetical protein
MNCVRFAAVLAVLVLMPPLARSATTTIGASKDNSIYQSQVNNSAGGAAGIFSGTNGAGSPRRGLIAFDIAANVPAGAMITDAQLTMYLGNAPNSNNQTIGLHRLTMNWGEGTAGSSTPAVGGGGNGFAAGTGDATWSTPTFGSGAWTNPGGTGDFIVTASASTVVNGPIETSFTWVSTPALVSDVQGWLTNPATNFGWALINAGESANSTVKAFYSRSATQNGSGGTLDPAWRPALTITYIPEPTTALLFVLACPLAIRHRRR